MSIICPDDGELELINKMLRAAFTNDETFVLHLYKNDYTPDSTTTIADFTEADFSGYTPKILYRTSWETPTVVGGTAYTQHESHSWTCGSIGNIIYGYYVTDSESDTILWAEKFSVATPLTSGNNFSMRPYFYLGIT